MVNPVREVRVRVRVRLRLRLRLRVRARARVRGSATWAILCAVRGPSQGRTHATWLGVGLVLGLGSALGVRGEVQGRGLGLVGVRVRAGVGVQVRAGVWAAWPAPRRS